MTLKELRIKLNLNQAECAKYLEISKRSYQQYENDEELFNSVKYQIFLDKLTNYYNRNNNNLLFLKEEPSFNTNVIIGDQLVLLYNNDNIIHYKKRYCFNQIQQYLNSNEVGKVCIIYGLRRTGKTTLLFQSMKELPENQTAYIKIQTTDTMSSLSKDLNTLFKLNIKYVFIDEITLLEDFINTSSILSDVYSMMGMKIILSGTDSLGFMVSSEDELYDRNIMIHTSYISFKEYAYLLELNSIDQYIEYGGTLKNENFDLKKQSLNVYNYNYDDITFLNDESTRKYIDTSISHNIQHSLKNNNFGKYFNELNELYNHHELTNVINRIVENMNHEFVLDVIKKDFKSHDLGSSKQLLLREAPKDYAYVLYDIDSKQVIDSLKKIIDIKNQEELNVPITDTHVNKIKKYLQMLDLIVNCPDYYDNGLIKEHYLFNQPGMRYSIAKALVYALQKDEYFNKISENDKEYIINKILNDVKGRMLEEIVLLETYQTLSNDYLVFKYIFDNGEFDMVVYDKINNHCKIYEIKHSDKINDNQVKHLRDLDKCQRIINRYGKIVKKIVLYRGETLIKDDIYYQNVEDYLKSL